MITLVHLLNPSFYTSTLVCAFEAGVYIVCVKEQGQLHFCRRLLVIVINIGDTVVPYTNESLPLAKVLFFGLTPGVAPRQLSINRMSDYAPTYPKGSNSKISKYISSFQQHFIFRFKSPRRA